MLDSTDLKLLAAIQENATATAQELSDRLNLQPHRNCLIV